jgi:hypothetical protein
MKTLVFLAASVAITSTVLAQGRVQFANTSATLIRTNFVEGGVSGSMSGAGQYVIGLFLGPAGSDFSSLRPVAYAQSAGLAGRFSGGANLVLPAPYDGAATIAFQVRAWSAVLGAVWADVMDKTVSYNGTGQPIVNMASPCGAIYLGSSAIGYVLPASGIAVSPGLFGTGPGQISGFDMYSPVCPEPSIVASAAVGLGALIMFRRRR